MSQHKDRLRWLMSKFGRSRFRYLEVNDGSLHVMAVRKKGAKPVAKTVSLGGAEQRFDEAPVENGDRVPKPSIPAPEVPAPEARVCTPESLRSPRVGHFSFSASKGGATALVAGERIEVGQVVGAIESMNIKHEVKAERGGVVAEVLVEDGEAVEYGQPLARIQEGPVTS